MKLYKLFNVDKNAPIVADGLHIITNQGNLQTPQGMAWLSKTQNDNPNTKIEWREI